MTFYVHVLVTGEILASKPSQLHSTFESQFVHFFFFLIKAEYNGVKTSDYVTQTFKSLSGNSIEIEQLRNGDQVGDFVGLIDFHN